MDKTKVIIISVIVVLLIGGIFLAFSKPNSNNNIDDANVLQNNNGIINNNQEENQNNTVSIEGVKTVGNLEISNIKITKVEDKKCELTGDVKNKVEEYVSATNLRIKVLDENGVVDEIFGGGITDLLPNEENSFKAIVLTDITDAADIEFEIIDKN